MTDLHQLLLDAGRPGAGPPSHVVDDDLTRGRRALARRRLRTGGTRSMLVAAAAIGSLVVVQANGGGQANQNGSAIKSPRTQTTSSAVQPSIKLVAYTGRQPDGYIVDSVPAGWEIQGVNNYRLTIAPTDSSDTDPDSFVGKLVVMLMSKDASFPTTGKHVAVGSTTGIILHADPSPAQLFFTDADGHVVEIQVPSVLHWTDEQIGQFGAAVHVNANAEAGVG